MAVDHLEKFVLSRAGEKSAAGKQIGREGLIGREKKTDRYITASRLHYCYYSTTTTTTATTTTIYTTSTSSSSTTTTQYYC